MKLHIDRNVQPVAQPATKMPFKIREHVKNKLDELGDLHPFRVVLGWAYRGLTGGFLLLQNFSVAISVNPHVCFILVLILISIFLR